MGKKIGIGFYGAGDVSILHGRAVEACNDAELIGIWNRTESKGMERAKQFSCKFYRDPLELVKDPEVDAVLVLTNLETHLPFTKLAIENGKHVLVEKPVGLTISEIEEMKNLSLKYNVICMPGHNVVYDENIIKIKSMIESGDIGRIVSFFYMFNSYFSEEAASRYPGVIRQIITHHLYTMLYLAGKPKEIMAMMSRLHYEKLTKEDLAMVILKLENNALAHLDLSFAADDLSSDPWTFLIKVLGTEGSARYSWQDKVLAKKGISHTKEFVAYPVSFINEVNYFVNICLNGGTPLSTLDDAIDAQSILEAIELSIEEKQGVSWPLKKSVKDLN